MLHYQILLIIGLLLTIIGLHMLSAKIHVSYPILLVLGGLAISEVPGVPHITLDPEFVFLIFLPPLLYEAAWYTSWHDFWRLKAPIGVQAFGLVFFTSMVVAYFVNGFIPGFPLAVGFLLGGIISPPDAVTATSVLDGLDAPKDAVTILEGESLINDASSLIVYQFALAAVLTSQFEWADAGRQLLWVALGGIGIGVALAQGICFIRGRLPTTPSIDTSLTLISPYLFYLTAESLESSGVLAVVAGGLFLSYRSHEFLTAKSHVQSGSVWSTLSFLLNGFVFLLIGLQLPVVVEGLGGVSLGRALLYAVAISLLTIAVRIIWVFPTAYLLRMLPSYPQNKAAAGWKMEMLVAWAGMRGVVSLASALAIPLTLRDGRPFPDRDLILFITFCVILVTLVLQGLSLPRLIQWLQFEPDLKTGTPDQQRESMSMRLALAAREYLELKYADECHQIPMFQRLRTSYEWTISTAFIASGSSAQSQDARELGDRYKQALLEMIDVQRKELILARREGAYDHDLTLEREDELNLEEARLLRSEEEDAEEDVLAEAEAEAGTPERQDGN
ncbi:MAG: Na+/H+ antiporter [Acidobacteriota bacterium]